MVEVVFRTSKNRRVTLHRQFQWENHARALKSTRRLSAPFPSWVCLKFWEDPPRHSRMTTQHDWRWTANRLIDSHLSPPRSNWQVTVLDGRRCKLCLGRVGFWSLPQWLETLSVWVTLMYPLLWSFVQSRSGTASCPCLVSHICWLYIQTIDPRAKYSWEVETNILPRDRDWPYNKGTLQVKHGSMLTLYASGSRANSEKVKKLTSHGYGVLLATTSNTNGWIGLECGGNYHPFWSLKRDLQTDSAHKTSVHYLQFVLPRIATRKKDS